MFKKQLAGKELLKKLQRGSSDSSAITNEASGLLSED